MRDGPAEILVSATSQTCCDMSQFLENFQQFSAAGDEKFLYLACDHQMNSAPYKNQGLTLSTGTLLCFQQKKTI